MRMKLPLNAAPCGRGLTRRREFRREMTDVFACQPPCSSSRRGYTAREKTCQVRVRTAVGDDRQAKRAGSNPSRPFATQFPANGCQMGVNHAKRPFLNGTSVLDLNLILR